MRCMSTAYVGGPRNCYWGVLFLKGQWVDGSMGQRVKWVNGSLSLSLYYIWWPPRCKKHTASFARSTGKFPSYNESIKGPSALLWMFRLNSIAPGAEHQSRSIAGCSYIFQTLDEPVSGLLDFTSRGSGSPGWKSLILIPFWLIIMWDCTALKMHLTQEMYVICTWDWQQNLTYVWYVAPSTQKSTLTCCYAPPTICWLKGKRGLTSIYK